MKNHVFEVGELSFSYACECGLVLVFKGDAEFKAPDTHCPACGADLRPLRSAFSVWQRFTEAAKNLPLKLRTPHQEEE
jgi:hypothetical protein